jgi:hypothetical protein
MDWLAVRAWIETGLAVELALGLGLTLRLALALALGLALALAAPLSVTAFLAVFLAVDGAKRVLLAGTSLRNEAKISLSSGCVHSTFAVSEGTTSERG